MIKTREPKVKGSPWKFRPHGQSGIEISQLFPHVAGLADESATERPRGSDTSNHDPGAEGMNTGNGRCRRGARGDGGGRGGGARGGTRGWG